MSIFHTHQWKLITKTYAPPRTGEAERLSEDMLKQMAFGVTTLLWECQDKNCQKIRKEEMLGKEL